MRITRAGSIVLASVAIALIATGSARAESHAASKPAPVDSQAYWFTMGQNIAYAGISAGSAAVSAEIAQNFYGPGIVPPSDSYTFCAELLLGAQATAVKQAVKQAIEHTAKPRGNKGVEQGHQQTLWLPRGVSVLETDPVDPVN
jgi:hypothetical protein